MSEPSTEQIPAKESILASTKKILGIDDSYDVFDLDIMAHINSALGVVNDLGVGPESGLVVTDRSTPWAALLLEEMQLHSVKTYLYFKVRLAFDPPQVPHLINALNEQIKELEWRMSVRREAESWQEPVYDTTTETTTDPIW